MGTPWRTSEPARVKVLLFRTSFTRMVMSFRNVSKRMNDVFDFGEVDVRGRGNVNLWRRQGLKRMPLVAVLRNGDQPAGLLGGAFHEQQLINFLRCNAESHFPRVSQDTFEQVALASDARFTAIFAADPRYVQHRTVLTALNVFKNAQKSVLADPALKDVAPPVQFLWADAMGEFVNTTQEWKSLHRVFGTVPSAHTVHIFVTDRDKRTFKDFGGNLLKLTDWSGKADEIKDFVTEYAMGKLKATTFPSPLFQEPPPPPLSQEEVTKRFIAVVVCAVVLFFLGFSFVTFKKEEAVREEIIKASGKKPKKERRDNNYEIGE